jgi:hypothetical protein
MTKNKSTKLTALLLAGVLATSCFVGGTLARYVTSTSSEDSARVAVWGINADEVTMDLFDATYTVNGVTVAQSEDGDNIIAPGTEKDNYFSIVNLDDNLKPEVMYEVAINLDDSEIDPLILNNPSIVWRLDEGTYGTWEETKAQVLALSGDASGVKTYAPLEIAENFKAGKTHKIGWKWIMDNNNNVMDTEMGNKAVDGDISAKIVIKVTATQVNVDTTGMLEGNGSVFNLNAPAPLIFKSAAPVDELQSVKVGDTTLTQGTDYTVSSGSTVITLKESYLSALTKGNYTISILSNSMTARATFAVTEVEEAPANDPLVHNGVIPEGGIYYVGSTSTTLGDYTGYSEKYIAGNNFPETVINGDIYVYGDYEYRYNYIYDGYAIFNYPWIENANINGWSARVLDKTKEYYGDILKTIANKDVTTLYKTFAECPNIVSSPQIPNTVTNLNNTFTGSGLTTAPIIPINVTSMDSTFRECQKLTTAPTIPENVTNINGLFAFSHNLTGSVEINANPTNYQGAFADLPNNDITITGSTTLKDEILATRFQ